MSNRKLNELRLARMCLDEELAHEILTDEEADAEKRREIAEERGFLLLEVLDVLIDAPHLAREGAYIRLRDTLVEKLTPAWLFDE